MISLLSDNEEEYPRPPPQQQHQQPPPPLQPPAPPPPPPQQQQPPPQSSPPSPPGRRLGGAAPIGMHIPAALRRFAAEAAERRAVQAKFDHGAALEQPGVTAAKEVEATSGAGMAAPAPGTGQQAALSNGSDASSQDADSNSLAVSMASMQFHAQASENRNLQQRYLAILEEQALDAAQLKQLVTQQGPMAQFTLGSLASAGFKLGHLYTFIRSLG